MIVVVIGRLYYWQVINGETLAAAAEKQHWAKLEIPSRRGRIITRDGYELVSNKPSYTIYADKTYLEISPYEVASRIAQLTTKLPPSYDVLGLKFEPEATQEVELVEGEPTPTPTPTFTPTPTPNINFLISEKSSKLQEQLADESKIWVKLADDISEDDKQTIQQLDIKGLLFQEENIRSYPEASSSAHILGFVGANPAGIPKGFFGLEGYYDLQLSGRPGEYALETDAFGNPILIGNYRETPGFPGRDLITHIDRAIQFQIEQKLNKAVQEYQAKSGSVILLDPSTGAIIAMASTPGYNPNYARYYPYDSFVNPNVARSYEPGSTFKVLTMAAGIDAGVITPETICSCRGPVRIGQYTISTWDFQYHPDSTMTEVLIHSDNVGMVQVGNALGTDTFVEYIKKFGFGSKTGIDLEDESSPAIRADGQWKEIDRATATFGQGIAVTPLQLIRAVAAIANDGWLMQPQVVDQIQSADELIEVSPNPIAQVISNEAAETVTEMMIQSAAFGEAKFAFPKGYSIAGKTGTAQVPDRQNGGYKDEKTIASFVGFAPADDPKFAMLVIIDEPQSSPWGSETAAPLWFSIAKDLFIYWNIQPQSP